MANTIARCANRQRTMSFIETLQLADFTGNSNVIDIAVPVGAVITRGSVTVKVVGNGTGTDLLDVGYLGTLEAYKADINLEALGLTALVPTGYAHTSSTNYIRLTRTPGGSDATTLTVQVEFDYLVEGKGDFTQD